MIIYEATKGEFIEDVVEDIIAKRIEENFIEKMGRRTSPSEIRSWNNSLEYMYKVLNTNDISDGCGVAIEYNIPTTGKRIDFMLTGLDDENRNNAIIFELKQWSEVEVVKDEDGKVRTFIGGAMRETTHPSYQASVYASLISDYNDAVEKENILLRPCVYLHNYEKHDDYDPIMDTVYDEYTKEAPVFAKGEVKKLREFINRYIKKADNKETIYKIDTGKTKPSKSLQDALLHMLQGKNEFKMIGNQKVIYEAILKKTKKTINSGEYQVFIIEGGPGTGKSVLAINLLVNLIKCEYACNYVTKNSAPRDVYHKTLKGEYKKKYIENLFNGSGSYTESLKDEIDVLIVDEAHRLNEKSGLFKNLGENQTKEIINASKVSIFFIDESQKVTTSDVGEKKEITRFAEEKGANLTEFKLESQFRCNGSEGYLSWIDDILEIKPSHDNFYIDYDFKIIDNPNEMRRLIEQKNMLRNKSRIVSGYCWNWKSKKGGKESNDYDIEIPEFDFKMKWNFSNSTTWAIDEQSVKESGCIHTCQGLEFDYVGVIIGNDLRFEDNKLITDFTKRASTDKSLNGIKGRYKKKNTRDDALAEADKIIRNTYKVLLTRGMKGCYVYCTDKNLSEYLKRRISIAKKK